MSTSTQHATDETQAYDAVLLEVRRIVAEILGNDLETVQANSVLLELGLQSFDFVELVFKLEAAFTISMPRLYAIPDSHSVTTYAKAVFECRQHGLAEPPPAA